ncbi:MAG: hypothetical protein HGA38_01235 [Candidatus Moranbacteria bacterium]|nr:hypothetical protein [Candidatus Moranbacteria bacterium]NTW45632.1 hypothetical protein [Candidatus Moranbacteria bacterium]
MYRHPVPKKVVLAVSAAVLVVVVSSYAFFRFFSDRNGAADEADMTVGGSDSDGSSGNTVPLPTDADGEPIKVTGLLGEELGPPPADPSMDLMKTRGCVADGLLNGDFPGDGKTMKLINDSKCYYLHRAIETWLAPPDFKDIDENLKDLRSGFTVGMFLAEAIDTKANYFYPFENRDFDFDRMCRPGSKNFWGEHTCKPYLPSKEYQTYLRYITRRAIDRGVQVFMFGQVYLQDTPDHSKSPISGVIAEMREYAAYHGMKIYVGAQTNEITDEAYLSNFDFIEGGVGLKADGTVEDGACFSRWWKKPGDWCWALLWNDRYRTKAKNVFVHYDWSGKIGDDMSVFTRMDEKARHETTARLHAYFNSKGVGFLIPYLARLNVANGGCVGPSARFYTPDDRFSCDDEAAWDAIFSPKK